MQKSMGKDTATVETDFGKELKSEEDEASTEGMTNEKKFLVAMRKIGKR